MNHALGLLLWLRLTSALRRMRRHLSSIKGILFAVFGLLILLPWLVSALVMDRPLADANNLAQMERFAPLALLAYCVMNLLFTSGESVLSFSPAEVNLLFPGPFSRRQLLAYKLMGSCLGILATGLFLTVVIRLPRGSFVAGYLGVVLALGFVQFFGTAVGLAANTVGVRAFSRWRRLILASVVVILVLAGVRLGRDLIVLPPPEVLRRLEQTPGFQTALEPLRWFARIFTATRLWPDLVQWTALGLSVNLVLVCFIFALDAHYLEGASVASERLYSKLQALRSGGAGALGLRSNSSGKPRLRIPMLPWWRGAGPILWRQLTTAVRSRGAIMMLVVLAMSLTGPVMATLFTKSSDSGPMPVLLLGAVSMLTVFLTALVAYDFRGDLDRMDVLKSLPIGSVPLAIGQILTPALLVSLLQWLAVLVLAVLAGRFEPVHAVMMALFLPFNFFLFGLENFLFLLFPTRIMATTPGDVQALGRNMLLLLVKGLAMFVVGTVCGVVWLVVWFLAGRNVTLGLAAAWFPLALFAAATVPLAAYAFRRYDVARDTPP